MSKMIELSDEQYGVLEHVAAARGQTPADALGPALHPQVRRVSDAAWDRASALVGRYHGGASDVAENHDAYLDEAYGQQGRRCRPEQSARAE